MSAPWVAQELPMLPPPLSARSLSPAQPILDVKYTIFIASSSLRSPLPASLHPELISRQSNFSLTQYLTGLFMRVWCLLLHYLLLTSLYLAGHCQLPVPPLGPGPRCGGLRVLELPGLEAAVPVPVPLPQQPRHGRRGHLEAPRSRGRSRAPHSQVRGALVRPGGLSRPGGLRGLLTSSGQELLAPSLRQHAAFRWKQIDLTRHKSQLDSFQVLKQLRTQ